MIPILIFDMPPESTFSDFNLGDVMPHWLISH